MKAAKWLKWKIGTVCAILLVLIFQLVKSSPQFQLQIDDQAASKASPGSIDLRADDDDSVMREWQEQDTPSSGGSFQESDGRQGRRFSRSGEGRGSVQQGGNGFDARTSRS
ncbi:hypothetical protein GZH47_17510 [Paenibacillus rhizovicinus]|uniref:Uncharacterized protein n=1 Tax=Paenibacillus rhizovicinus TaxID=2704463 RepID=A0A6C0P1T6_9BACL|nr:hypothetical protein [Paenibacillus rhizovicinus]QHW32429.1 hypothetical protein GZH47_17510 [Paenibacillus rhizovicinus]